MQMSDNIKLPAQEWLGYDPERGDIHGYSFEQMREFTELIIQKCISQIALIGISNYQNDDVMWATEKAIDNIREHFGMKNETN
jgi:hypothetical protein